jgi:isoleucyl-tRNA synthetase
LWNVYLFFVMYANIDNYKPDPRKTTAELPELDRWILSELNQLILDVDSALKNYNPTSAGRKIEDFVDMLSNWYVRRSRRRFWKSENDSDKLSAYNTLYQCLVTVSKLLAPFTPFIAEEMYQNLVRVVDKDALLSVHLTDFPVADQRMINHDLSESIRQAMKISSLGRATRAKAGIKVRQPLDVCYVINSPENKLVLENEATKQSVLDELNVKFIKLSTTEGLAEMAKSHDFVVDDVSVTSTAMCINISPELLAEGLAREIVHRLQTMRKSAGFEIADYITTYYQGDDYLRQVMTDFADYLKQETLSRELIDSKPEEGVYTETFKLSGRAMILGVKKIS